MASPEELVTLSERLCELEWLLRENGKTPKVIEGVELYDGEARTLKEIARREGITQMELSQHMCRTKGATSAVADRLEEKGLVRRVRTDTRCMLHLTDLGRRVCRAKSAQELRQANQVAEELPVELDALATANEVLEQYVAYCRKRYQRQSEKGR